MIFIYPIVYFPIKFFVVWCIKIEFVPKERCIFHFNLVNVEIHADLGLFAFLCEQHFIGWGDVKGFVCLVVKL